MVSPRIGVLALQGDVREHVRMLVGIGAEALPVRRSSELEAVHGLVVPGGESTAMIRLLRSFDLLGPLRAAVAGGLPVLGTCAGLILLADRIVGGEDGQEGIGGLDVTVRRNAFGRQIDSFDADLDVPVLGPEPVRAAFIRGPVIEETGSGVEVLASLPDGRAVAVRQGPLIGLSFHPEITGEDRFHRLLRDVVRG
ncbi:pyridoxal 5'-phosphate synthase glutaminase subunit PdxT [Brachybacterium hainanense]|uniref:Pyridoxal 5'-phosphate synthase subunit PdxT n=1 Tax=Brachybacterium hainanense TaxID=1541174 RepID=A0ABV6R8Z4_9MICO